MKNGSAMMIVFVVFCLNSPVIADSLKMVVQHDLIVDTPISKEHPSYGMYLLKLFMMDGSVTTEVQEPSCNLYVYSPVAVTIKKGTVLIVKSENINLAHASDPQPGDTSQAIFHKDRGVIVHGDVESGRELRVSCSDSASRYWLLLDFTKDVINQVVGQFVIIE